MKYMLLIHQGAAPTPRSADESGRLSEDEQKALAGYLLFEADLDAAIELAAGIQAARLGGAIEVRPVVEW